ncbi:MAG: hypothetical protein V3T33_09905 [Myxococcota bacterium]
MKPIAICLLGLFLLLGPTAVKSAEAEPAGEDSAQAAESDHRHRHHSHFALFRRHSDAEGTCTRLLSVPFFSLYRSEQWSDHRDRRVLSLPFLGSLYRHRVDGNRHRREFLYVINIETES